MDQFRKLIETSTGASDHLEFTVDLMERQELSDEVRTFLHAQIEDVRTRLDDPYLYMAVIGEASSGKSTFINALLGTPLLEMGSVTETTAAATVIKHGDALTAAVRFRFGNTSRNNAAHGDNLEFIPDSIDMSSTELLSFTTDDEPISIGGFPEIDRLSVGELIRKVTTEPRIARRIASVGVTCPANFLSDGICIIDTPGTNVSIEDHKQVTQRAVAYADGAIILTTARSPMPSSLVSLLHDELRLGAQIQRCAFLITKMDWIAPEERDAVVKHVQGQIKRHLANNGKVPPVFYAVPKTVVEVLDGKTPNNAETETWIAQFEQLKNDLHAFLKRQRATVISEKVLRLLNDLFTGLDSHLQELWEQYEADRDALENAVIPDLKLFTKEQKRMCHDLVQPAIDQAAVKVQIAADQFRDRLLKEVESDINRKGSMEELKSYIETTLPGLFKTRVQGLQKEIEPHVTAVNEAATKANKRFDREFRDAYKRLRTLRHEIRDNHQRSDLSGQQIDLSTVGSSGAFEGPSVGAMMTGAVIGAYIGSVVFFGLGTVVGAVIGGFLSSLFGPSLDERKRKIWDEVRPKLVEALSDMKTKAHSSVTEQGKILISQLEASIKEHERYYALEVQKLRDEQAEEEDRLSQLQEVLERDKHEIARRRDLVRAQLKKLSTITF